MKTLNNTKPIRLARKILPNTMTLVSWLLFLSIILFSGTTCREKECDFEFEQFVTNPDTDFTMAGPGVIALTCKSRADTTLIKDFRLDSIVELSTRYKLQLKSNLLGDEYRFDLGNNKDSICGLIRFYSNLLGARGGKATIGVKYHTDTLLLFFSHSGGIIKRDTVVQRYHISTNVHSCMKKKGYLYHVSLNWRSINDPDFGSLNNDFAKPVYYISHE